MIQHDRRRLVHFNVTAHPTAEWTARQILETFPFETAPRYLLRDRDRIYGKAFCEQVAAMNIKEVTARHCSTASDRHRGGCHLTVVIGLRLNLTDRQDLIGLSNPYLLESLLLQAERIPCIGAVMLRTQLPGP